MRRSGLAALLIALCSACGPDPVKVDFELSLDEASCGTCSPSQIVLPGNGGYGAFYVHDASGSGGGGFDYCVAMPDGGRLSDLDSQIRTSLIDDQDDGEVILEEGPHTFGVAYFAPPFELEGCDMSNSPNAAIYGETVADVGKHDNPIKIVLTCATLACP